MNALILLLVGCSPNDVTVDNGTFHAWLAVGSSATLEEGEIDLESDALTVTTFDCSALEEGETQYPCPYEDLADDEDDSNDIAALDQDGPFSF